MSTWSNILDSNPSEAERLGAGAVKHNSNMKDFSDFKNALASYFGESSQGAGGLSAFSDDEAIIIFNSEVVKDTIRSNISSDEYSEMFEDGEDTLIIREKARQSLVSAVPVTIKKEIKASSYKRRGKSVKGYSRSYNRWTKTQETFLKSAKKRNLPMKTIVYQYSRKFRDSPRSRVSVRNKVYRL